MAGESHAVSVQILSAIERKLTEAHRISEEPLKGKYDGFGKLYVVPYLSFINMSSPNWIEIRTIHLFQLFCLPNWISELPAAELRGILNALEPKTNLLIMLIPNILSDNFCCYIVANRTDKVTVIPEFSSPKFFLYLGEFSKHHLCRYAFDYLHYSRWSILRWPIPIPLP